MNRDPLEKAENYAQKLGRLIKNGMPEGYSFFLILSSNGGKGVCTYLSSAERKCAIEMLREMANHLENNGKEI